MSEHLASREIQEWRRLRAVELDRLGWWEVDIAEALGVHKGTVSKWLAVAKQKGPDALLAHPTAGHPPKLGDAQKRLIPELLWHGAEAYGFRGDVWTCARIAQVVQREFGVLYHKDHVSRLMQELGWTPQVPITRALQRDEAAIEYWRVAVWPELRRKAARERRALVFVDESGFYLLPGVVKTYGPKGKTPVIDKWLTRDHLSVMGGLTLAGKLYTLIRPEALTSEHTVIATSGWLASVATPIPYVLKVDNKDRLHLFISSSYNKGCALIAIEPKEGGGPASRARGEDSAR